MARFYRVLALSPIALIVVSSCGQLCLSEPPYSLADVCERLPKDLCGVRAPGCELTGIGFDKEVCEARVRASCVSDVEDVRAGKLVFRRDEIPACLASLKPVSKAATTDLHAVLVGKAPCARIFEGKLGPLDRCERDSPCAQPAALDQLALCNKDQRCELVKVLRAGERCELDNDGNHRCDTGLACVVQPNSGDPDYGTCEPELGAGQTCNPIDDLVRCGRALTCDRETLSCVPRRPLGSRCWDGLSCVSGHCTDGICGPDTTLFTPWECGQPCLGTLCD